MTSTRHVVLTVGIVGAIAVAVLVALGNPAMAALVGGAVLIETLSLWPD